MNGSGGKRGEDDDGAGGAGGAGGDDDTGDDVELLRVWQKKLIGQEIQVEPKIGQYPHLAMS